MPSSNYDTLVDELCQLKSLARPDNDTGTLHLALNGIPFTLLAGGVEGGIEGIVYACDFGPLPHEFQPRAAALQQLMETNLYLFGADAPRFGCNAENGHVVYVGYVALDTVTAESVLQMLELVSQEAEGWRQAQAQQGTRAASQTQASLRSRAASPEGAP